MHANEYYASTAIEAIDAGKHFLIEKPMAICMQDGEVIVTAQARNQDVVVFLGYQRRYTEAMEVMKREVASIKNLAYAKVQDIVGPLRGPIWYQRFPN